MAWILPATTQVKDPRFYEKFTLKGKDRFVALTQLRTLSSRRIIEKLGTIERADFDRIVKKVLTFFPKTKEDHTCDPLL